MPRPKQTEARAYTWQTTVEAYLGTTTITPELVTYRLWWWRRLDRLQRDKCIKGSAFKKLKQGLGKYRSELTHLEHPKDWIGGDSLDRFLPEEHWVKKEYDSEVDHWCSGNLSPSPRAFSALLDCTERERQECYDHWFDHEMLARGGLASDYALAVDIDWDESPWARSRAQFERFIKEAPDQDTPGPVAPRVKGACRGEPEKTFRDKKGRVVIWLPSIDADSGEDDEPGEFTADGKKLIWDPSTLPPKWRYAVRKMDRLQADKEGRPWGDSSLSFPPDIKDAFKVIREIYAEQRKRTPPVVRRKKDGGWVSRFHKIEMFDLYALLSRSQHPPLLDWKKPWTDPVTGRLENYVRHEHDLSDFRAALAAARKGLSV